MTLRLFALSALLFAQVGVMPAGAQAVSQSNETISLSVGASETIALSENPSIGYEWQLDTTQSSNLAIVRVIDVGYQASQSGQMAAAGSHWWQIEARAPGTARNRVRVLTAIGARSAGKEPCRRSQRNRRSIGVPAARLRPLGLFARLARRRAEGEGEP